MTAPTVNADAARNADLADLVQVLKGQRARSLDVVAAPSGIRSEGGTLVIAGTEPEITEDGVTNLDGRYAPNAVADEGIAEKLGIPLAYVRRMRNERTDLYDANVNGWLQSETRRKFLIRALRSEDGGGTGIARAFLSDTYKTIDNLDVLIAAIDGIGRSGVNAKVASADISDRRMYVRIVCPEVQTLAPDLLRGYRSPFGGRSGTDNPVVSAGFVISNSDTGCGAFTIVPRLVVEVCSNGMTVERDAVRHVHLGARMHEGVVRWSDDTQRKTLGLITSVTRDAVATFLDADYIRHHVETLNEKAAHPVEHPDAAVKVVTKQLAFTEAQQSTILSHFIQGGVQTRGGLLHAVTSAAQVQTSADAQYDMERKAPRVLNMAL